MPTTSPSKNQYKQKLRDQYEFEYELYTQSFKRKKVKS